MKSIFLRRLLLALVIMMLIASATMVGGYVFISRDTYTDIKLDEMIPKAEAAKQLIIEYMNWEIGEEALARLSETQILAVNGATLFVDKSGNYIKYKRNGNAQFLIRVVTADIGTKRNFIGAFCQRGVRIDSDHVCGGIKT